MAELTTQFRCSAVVWDRPMKSVLLVRRLRGGRPEYVLPGGTPKPGEAMHVCARREVLEETGVRVMFDQCAFITETFDSGGRRLVDIIFSAQSGLLDEKQRLDPVEPELEPVVVDVEELPKLTLLPPLGGYLRGFARGRQRRTIPVLGNLWRPHLDNPGSADPYGLDTQP